jgi:membrane-associated protein
MDVSFRYIPSGAVFFLGALTKGSLSGRSGDYPVELSLWICSISPGSSPPVTSADPDIKPEWPSIRVIPRQAGLLCPCSYYMLFSHTDPEMFPAILEFLIHIDQNLAIIVDQYGFWTYFILFVIIMLETGLVVAPFLPGDSLLFVAGAMAATNTLDIYWLFIVFIVAAIVGDTINYWIGNYLGLRVIMKRFPNLIKKEYVTRTYGYFEKYGGKTIFIARFIPIVRTVAPFLAGVGSMNYRRFLIYNVAGAVAWTLIVVSAGYLFGQAPIVQDNINLLVYAVLFVTIVTIVIVIYGLIKAYRSPVPDEE